MTRSNKHGDSSRKKRAHSFKCKHEVERTNWKELQSKTYEIYESRRILRGYMVIPCSGIGEWRRGGGLNAS